MTFCTPTGLYEWLVMRQSSRASPGWFVKLIDDVIKGLEQVVAYLDDVIILRSDPTAHVKTMWALFEHLRKHNPKLPASTARLEVTGAEFPGHSISPAGVRLNAQNKSHGSKSHTAGSKAVVRLAGQCGVGSQIPARLVQADPTDHLPTQEGNLL